MDTGMVIYKLCESCLNALFSEERSLDWVRMKFSFMNANILFSLFVSHCVMFYRTTILLCITDGPNFQSLFKLTISNSGSGNLLYTYLVVNG